jgi:phosphate-selective porin OprO/OprP
MGVRESAARYDVGENLDQNLAEGPRRTGTSKRKIQVITLGANRHVWQGLRSMLNYYLTDVALGNAGPGILNRNDKRL